MSLVCYFFCPELFPSEYNEDAELDEDPLTAAAAACAAAATALDWACVC